MTASDISTREPRISSKLSFREKNPVRIGLIGTTTILVVLFALFNAHAIVALTSTYNLSAVFSEAGGLKPGNDVRLYGRPVGRVTGMELDRNTVVAKFQVSRGISLRGGTNVDIKTATALGVKYLALVPGGSGVLKAGTRVPISRTSSPYDVTQALADLTTTAQGVNSKQLGGMLDQVNNTFKDTSTQLGNALTGVTGLSDALTARDDDLKQLFQRSAAVTTVLARRKDQVQKLVNDGDVLATELTSQKVQLAALIRNIDALADQLNTFVTDGQKHLRPALTELRQLLIVLKRSESRIDTFLQGLPLSARGLAESVGSGPFFTAYIGNIAPDNGFPILGGGR